MKIKENIKNNGEVVYKAQVFLGTDSYTGKPARKTITAKSKKEVNKIAHQAKEEFIKNGNTTFNHATATTFKELANLWLESYKPTVKLQSYQIAYYAFNKHILPRLGGFKLQKLNSVVMQQFVNDVANSGFVNYRTIL